VAALTRRVWGETGIPEATMRGIRAQYAGLIRHMDAAIGRAVATFRRRFGQEALIVFTSDHGDFLGEHHHAHQAN